MWLIRKQGTSLHENNCHIFADIYRNFMHRIVCAFAENVTTEDEIFFLHSVVLLIFMHRGHCHRER